MATKGSDQKTSSDPETVESPAFSAQNRVDAQLTYIGKMIDRLVVRQPLIVQVIVLFVFLFLFVYLIIYTTVSYTVLPLTIEAYYTADEIAVLKKADKFVSSNAHHSPPSDYMVKYGDNYYGLDQSGTARIDIPVIHYLAALAARRLDVTIFQGRNDGSPSVDETVAFGWFGLQPIAFKPKDALGALERSDYSSQLAFGGAPPLRVSTAWAPFESASAQDNANSAGGRLYIQGLTIPANASNGPVSATLTWGTNSVSAVSLTPDLRSQTAGALAVQPGAPLVLDYQTFFSLPKPAIPKDAQIELAGGGGLFSKAYNEAFELPPAIQLGQPTQISGKEGGTLVIELASRVDVVFFERGDTRAMTELMLPLIAPAGYAPRVNTSAAILPGEYNVIYAGADVPTSAVRDVVKLAAQAGLSLRSIQPQLQLKNGIQNQIQVGSSDKVACLPVISAQSLSQLTQASDAAFLTLLPRGDCPPNN